MTPDKPKLDEFLRECADLTEKELERLIPAEEVRPERLHKAIRHSVFAGGKRFRPALVFAVGDSFGAAKSELSTVAAAVEMIHTYSLIHDDLPAMDNDDLRRGLPTCHREFGEATAILAGDVLQTLAFRALAEDEKLIPNIRLRLITELAAASGTPSGMAAGQQMDLDGEQSEVSFAELEEIHRNKTGAMIVASARMGAIVGNASEDHLQSVGRYAANLGLLFQLTDDLLDVTQTTAVLGKTAGKDADDDKATYPALLGIEETRRLATEIHSKVCRDLDSIHDSGLLREIAGFVLNRKR